MGNRHQEKFGFWNDMVGTQKSYTKQTAFSRMGVGNLSSCNCQMEPYNCILLMKARIGVLMNRIYR